MRCPYCHGDDTQVMDTRVSDEGDAIRRRRRCTACDKRFTTHERAELTLPSIVKKNGSRIEEKLQSLGEKEIPSERVGELVMRELKRLDKVAYIRFASVYRSFADIESFESALKELK